MIRAVTLVAIALAVAGCGISRQGYSSVQDQMKSDPKKLNQAIDFCMQMADDAPAEQRQRFASRHKIPVRDVSRAACTRVMKGWASNRLTYEKYRELHKVGAGVDILKTAESL